jgi:hypothetical protein
MAAVAGVLLAAVLDRPVESEIEGESLVPLQPGVDPMPTLP